MNNIVISAVFTACFFGLAMAGPIEDLQPGCWYEVPNSHLRSVAFQWPGGITYTLNGLSVNGVMDQWCSGAYDTKRDRLYVWGGGHNGYGGNEIYAFDVNTLQWLRLTDPSLVLTPDCKILYSDSTPEAGHSYDVQEYIPSADLYAVGGNIGWGCGGANGAIVYYDLAAGKWEYRQNHPNVSYGSSAYDPVSGHLWVLGGYGDCFLSEYDPVGDTWTKRSTWETCFTGVNLVIDSVRRKLVGIGKGNQWTWDIGQTGLLTRTTLSTTGPQDLAGVDYPALAYDAVSGKLVGWNGGADVFTLDLGTNQWTRVTPAAANTVTPTAPNSTGTYGRFRYIPSKNAFIVVNDVDEDVFIYRLTAGTGTGVSAGTNDGKGEISLKVSPNPFKTTVNINYELQITNYELQSIHLSVYDINGRCIKDLTNKIHNSSFVICNLSGFPAGVYLARLTIGNKTQTKPLFLTK